jgi:hypothetical protein
VTRRLLQSLQSNAARLSNAAPPLSGDLRDFPLCAGAQIRLRPSVDGTGNPISNQIRNITAFQSVIFRRSFCLSVSGAVAPSAPIAKPEALRPVSPAGRITDVGYIPPAANESTVQWATSAAAHMIVTDYCCRFSRRGTIPFQRFSVSGSRGGVCAGAAPWSSRSRP